MTTLVFTNQKGGVGKSTLSVLWALHAADRCGERVCVIDLDAQANTSKTLRAHDSGVAAAALFRPDPLPSAPAGPPGASGREDAPGALVLLAGSKALLEVERQAPDQVLPAFVGHLRVLGRRFDQCVIDTPPALGLRMSAALMAAQFVCCPIELEEYSLDGVTDMLKTVLGVQQRYNPGLSLLGLLANRFNAHSPRQKAALEELLARYREFMLPAKLSTRSAIPEALAAGLPVWRLPKSAAREATAEVLGLFTWMRARMQSSTAITTGDGAAAQAEAETP
jgi:chromosome partitioning protein